MLILGIETSCDEMAVALVQGGVEVLANEIASQSDFHSQYGGVFPEMAARQHVDLLIPTIETALQTARVGKEEIDRIAVTRGPGLIGSLLVGLNSAKALSLAWNKPLIGVNHIEAHLYGAMMTNQPFVFPAIGLVVSGGHTLLVKIEGIGQYQLIGQTVDDAVGEAFDKVAAMLDLPYPGGPEIERLARRGDASKYGYHSGVVKGKPWDFSLSGLKTNVLYTVKGQNGNRKSESVIREEEKADVAASFQRAALKDVAEKTLKAAEVYGAKAIYVGGGVSQNQRLRELLNGLIPVFWPEPKLCPDNAAMIAGLAAHLPCEEGLGLAMTADPRLQLV